MTLLLFDHDDSIVSLNIKEHLHVEPLEAKWPVELLHEEHTARFEQHIGMLASQFTVNYAINLYRHNLISLGRAAEIANLSYGVMARKLRESGISLRFGAPVEIAEKRSGRLVEKLKRLRGRS